MKLVFYLFAFVFGIGATLIIQHPNGPFDRYLESKDDTAYKWTYLIPPPGYEVQQGYIDSNNHLAFYKNEKWYPFIKEGDGRSIYLAHDTFTVWGADPIYIRKKK